MKTNKFKITSLCHAIVLGNNRALELYCGNKLISRYPSISKCGGLKNTLQKAKKDAYKSVNHSR